MRLNLRMRPKRFQGFKIGPENHVFGGTILYITSTHALKRIFIFSSLLKFHFPPYPCKLTVHLCVPLEIYKELCTIR